MRRTVTQVAILGGAVLAWRLSHVTLLVFAAVVVAVLLRSVADPLVRHTPLKSTPAVLAAVLFILGILGLAGWVFGGLLREQAQELWLALPQSWAEARARAAATPFGPRLVDELQHASGDLADLLRGAAVQVGAYALTMVGALTNLLVVLFTGLFLALQPAQARDGLLSLLPRRSRRPVRDAFDASGAALKLWVLGMLADMLAVGVLTGLGAWALGLPSPLALGLIAAVLDFVPIVGPIASVIPGLLVATPLGPATMGWTLLMYLVVQQVEGNLIYPLIQRRAVDLSPVLSLISVVVFGVLFGPLGVVLATPILVVAVTMTKLLYLQNTLGEETEVAGIGARGGSLSV